MRFVDSAHSRSAASNAVVRVSPSMWCRHCQQDVPAIAQSYAGSLICPRCDFALPPHSELSEEQTLGAPTDAGIELDQWAAAEPVPPSAREILDSDSLQACLREIGRKLGRSDHKLGNHHPGNFDQGSALTLLRQPLQLPGAGANVPVSSQIVQEPPNAKTFAAQPSAAGWWLSVLLLASIVSLACGLAVLAWSAAFTNMVVWHNALTITLAGEGGLIVGLAWMAMRLWHNSRRVNRQLAGVDRQLDALQFATERRAYDSDYYRRVA